MTRDYKGAAHVPFSPWELSRFFNKNFRCTVCRPFFSKKHSLFIGFKKLQSYAAESHEYSLFWIHKRLSHMINDGVSKKSFTINLGKVDELVLTFYSR